MMRPDHILQTAVVLGRIFWAIVGAALYHLWQVLT